MLGRLDPGIHALSVKFVRGLCREPSSVPSPSPDLISLEASDGHPGEADRFLSEVRSPWDALVRIYVEATVN